MSEFPAELAQALEEEKNALGGRELASAAEELSRWYRAGRQSTHAFAWRREHWLAYALTRQPATFAAVSAVFDELALRAPHLEARSLLDLCSGPGTALWAAAATFPQLNEASCVERESGFIDLGRRLASQSGAPLVRQAQWSRQDLAAPGRFEPHDLVSLSYGAGELSPQGLERLVEAAWQAARKALVIVEPGTPAGYQTILACREKLIALGAKLAAPCPHAAQCPMAGSSRWCHFSVRLARTRLHRLVKQAELGYEDEKYAYVIFTREASQPFEARIVGYPRLAKPGVRMELCTRQEGLKQQLVAKRERDSYHEARRARWGDSWPR